MFNLDLKDLIIILVGYFIAHQINIKITPADDLGAKHVNFRTEVLIYAVVLFLLFGIYLGVGSMFNK